MRSFVIIACTLLLLAGQECYAQKGNDLREAPQTRHYQKSKRSTYVATNIPVKINDVKTLKEIVGDYFEDVKEPGVSLVLMRQKESAAAYHYRFQQMYRGLPVYNATADLVLSKKGILKSIVHSLEHTFPQQIETALNADLIARKHCQEKNYKLEESPHKVIFHNDANNVEVAISFKVINQEGLVEIVVLNADGSELLFNDMLSQLHSDNDISLSIGNVFLPDPLTSAQVAFGGVFGDNNDQSNDALNGEMRTVQLETCFNEATGLYELRNDVLHIVDFDSANPSPNVAVPPPTSSDGEFFFNRSESGFEAVSAFYHITEMHRHVESLGFQDFCSTVLQVDARAAFGGNVDSDNSVYSPSHRISFGTGGIDDAEDADVCVHEYGHALSNCANGNSNTSMSVERDAIEEGLCDYFAASYSKEISDFQSNRVFNWDGNFGGWMGRTVTSIKQYPVDLVDNQYSDAPIWSSVLMEIWDELGREVTDQLLMEALFAFTPNMDMTTAAQLVLNADAMLNECGNFDVLTRYFHKRGMIDYVADAGEDQEICTGETAVLGGKLSNLFNGVTEWTPSIGLSDPDALHPTANPPVTTTYTVTVTDNLRNEVYTDGVTVTVKTCLTEFYSDEVELLNSGDLALFGQGAVLRFPETAVVQSINVFDSSGRNLGELNMNADNMPLNIDLSNRAPGVYVLEVKMPDESKVFKLLSAY